MRYITLKEWDEQLFSKPHGIATLRTWAKTGQIHPLPIKVGNRIMVEETARYVPLPSPAANESTGLLADPLVSEIFLNGAKTA